MEYILPRWEQKLNSYRRALSRLAEVVNVMKVRQYERMNDLSSYKSAELFTQSE